MIQRQCTRNGPIFPLALTALLATAASAGHAATVQEEAATALTLDAFVRTALERAPGAEAADRRVDAARLSARQRLAMGNPELILEDPDDDGFELLEILQPLPWFGQRGALRRLGDATVDVADREAKLARSRIARDAARLYYGTAALRAERSILADVRRLREREARRLEMAVRSGLGSRAAALEARLAAAAARRALAEAERRLSGRLALMNRWIGRRPDAELRLSDELPGAPTREPVRPGREADASGSPQLQAAEAAVRQAEGELGWARARTRPRPAIGPVLSLDGGLDVGVGLETRLPLWDRNRDGTRAAETRLEAARADRDAARAETRRRLEELRAGYETTVALLELLRRDELGPATELVEVLRQATDRGLPVTARRVQAELDLLSLEREALLLRRDLATLTVELAWLTGGLPSR